MPENANAPGTAPTGGGQSAASPSAPAAGGAPDLKQVLEAVQTLRSTFDTKSKEWDNLRSMHDRQMDEIRRSLAGGKSGGSSRQEANEDGDGNAAAPAGGPRPIGARELAFMRDNAILKFRGEFPDWQTYWKDIEAIGSDPTKARPFVRYTNDPETGELIPDFYSSLVDIRKDLELQRLRTAQAATNPAAQQAANASAQARADASAIGGSAASIPENVLGADYANLPYNEKIKRLHAAGLLDIDPNDPPEALR